MSGQLIRHELGFVVSWITPSVVAALIASKTIVIATISQGLRFIGILSVGLVSGSSVPAIVFWFGRRISKGQTNVRLLFESTPAEFRSAYGIAESVERLSAATKRSVFAAFGETAAVGKVSEKSVRLQRVIPMVGNSFKPFFTGRFEVRDGVTVLVGRFGMLIWAKVFMTFWLGLMSLFAVGVLLGGLRPQGPHATFFLWQPFLMLGFGVALVAVGKWFARNDVAWLSEVIGTALGAPGAAPKTQGALTQQDPDTVPPSLKWAAIFLAASGAMGVVAGIAGPRVWPSAQQSADIPAPLQLGNWNFVYALAVISLALGIWRRRPWAWWGGFLLLGASVCVSFLVMPTDARIGLSLGVRVIFAVFSCVVVGVWGRWWYMQRKHFVWG